MRARPLQLDIHVAGTRDGGYGASCRTDIDPAATGLGVDFAS